MKTFHGYIMIILLFPAYYHENAMKPASMKNYNNEILKQK